MQRHRADVGLTVTGFEYERNVYRLIFEDPSLNGLVVRMESIPIGQYMDVVELAGIQEEAVGAEQVQALNDLLKSFADALVDWNLTKRGVPVPADLDGVRGCDTDLVLKQLIGAWLSTVAGVPDPLGKGSAGGESAPAESPTTEPS